MLPTRGISEHHAGRRRSGGLIGLALVAGALLLSGCGNDVDEGASGDSATSASEEPEVTNQAPVTTESAGADGSDGSTGGTAGQPDGGEYPPGDPAAEVAEYGTNAQWDRAADACEAGQMVGCDALTTPEAEQTFAPEGTEMNVYGQTCGGRVPPKLDNFCQQLTFNPGEG